MNAIKKISSRAKVLQKKHPNTAWKNLIKQASREYRNGKLPQTRRKKTKPKKVAKRKIGGLRKKSVRGEVVKRATGAGLTIAAATHFIQSELKDKLGRDMVRQHLATTKRDKRKIGKTIADTKRKLRKLK